MAEQRQEAPRRLSRCSLQELLLWGHDGRAAPDNSHPVPWGISRLCPRELGFLHPHLAMSLLMSSIKFNKDSTS